MLQITNLYHSLLFVVVDKPAAWKQLDGGMYSTISHLSVCLNNYSFVENPKEAKPWPKDGFRKYGDDDRHHDRRPRSPRRHQDYASRYDDIPSRYRDPEYERYLEMRYMEERLAERYRYERLYDRYPPPSRDYMSYRGLDRYDYPLPPPRGYDYLRDDDYERDRRPFDYRYR